MFGVAYLLLERCGRKGRGTSARETLSDLLLEIREPGVVQAMAFIQQAEAFADDLARRGVQAALLSFFSTSSSSSRGRQIVIAAMVWRHRERCQLSVLDRRIADLRGGRDSQWGGAR